MEHGRSTFAHLELRQASDWHMSTSQRQGMKLEARKALFTELVVGWLQEIRISYERCDCILPCFFHFSYDSAST